MRLSIAAVGRMKAGADKTLFDDYTRRLSWPFALREVEEKRALPPAERTRKEGEMLLAQVAEGARIVVLDERGKTISSEAFAEKLGGWRDEGISETAFLIGGADGHSPVVREKASLLLSFGSMTWPHMLVRVMLAEQLYRAQSILAGHPYHRA